MEATVGFHDILSAAERLAGIAQHTPLLTSRRFDALVGKQVFFKAEHLQRSGSFKFRGAYNALSRLTPEQRSRGVVAFSSGNHAQGVALAAQLLGIAAVIVMPDDAPPVKLAATRGYGAEIISYDRLTTDREALARSVAESRGLTLIPPFDHPHIIAGQGTLAHELLSDVADLDALIVPVGGGGLISGCAIAAHGRKPALRIYGVEPAVADDVRQSLAAGRRISIAPPDTLADGVRTTSPGQLTFPIMQQHLTDVLTVSETQLREALRWMLLYTKQVIEPTAALGPAVLQAGLLPADVRRVGVVLCGGNIDPVVLKTLW
jgi:threo-3-hydroxy-L-aspartate ammonia-lyase